jgi:hypothetical protein
MGGMSFSAIILPLIIWQIIFILNFNNYKLKYKSIFIIIIYIGMINIMIRMLVYNIGGGIIISYLRHFSLYLPPFFIIIFRYTDIIFKRRMITVMKIVLVLQGILALFYMLGLPTINILTDDHYQRNDVIRYVGIFSGSNVNSNFNALLVLIILFGDSKIQFKEKIFYVIIGFVSIAPSFSRLPFIILVFLCFIILFDFKNFTQHILKLIIMFIGIFFTSYCFPDIINNIFDTKILNRVVDLFLYGDNSNRMLKNAEAMKLISDNSLSFLIGIPASAWSSSSIPISDNSILMQCLRHGSLFIIIFIILGCMLLQDTFKSSLKVNFYRVCLLVTIFSNNAIMWIPWVYFSIMGYFIIIDNDKI